MQQAVRPVKGRRADGRLVQQRDAHAPTAGIDRKRVQQLCVPGRGIPIPHVEIVVVAAAPPFLTADGGDLRRDVRIIVEIIEPECAVFVKHMRDGRVLAVLHGVLVLREEQRLQRPAQHHAVREERDGLPRVALGDLAQRLQEAAGIDRERLAALGAPRRGMMGEIVGAFRVTARELGEGRVLPDAAADLAQAALAVQRQPLRGADCARRRAGARQVAGIDRVDRNVAEARGQRRDLAHPVGGNHGIVLSLKAAEHVALCLGMSNEI